jgi:ABC-2 type transport system permease protein
MADIPFESGRIAPERRSRIYWAISDSLVLIVRSARHILRNLDQLLLVVMLPINVLLLFRYVFGGAIDTGETPYVNYMIAGIIVQGIAFNMTSTAVGVCSDVQGGMLARLRTLPILDSAMLIGHVVADLARNLISALIIVAVGTLVGFRPTAGALEWAAVLGLVLLFTLALAWVSVIFGLLAKSVEGAGGLTFIFVFLPYVSSAFVPTAHMPGPLRFFAENQPITHVIEALRALMIGAPLAHHGWLAVAWCGAILLAASTTAVGLFKRKTAR